MAPGFLVQPAYINLPTRPPPGGNIRKCAPMRLSVLALCLWPLFVAPSVQSLECTAGHYPAADGSACLTCPAWSSSAASATGCTCYGGFFYDDGRCVECGYGAYCPGDNVRYTCTVAQEPCTGGLTTVSRFSESAGACVCESQSGEPPCTFFLGP